MVCNHGILRVMLFILRGISVVCVGDRINYSSLVPTRSQPLPCPFLPFGDTESHICTNKRSKHTVLAHCLLFTEDGGQSAVDQARNEKSQVWLWGHHKQTEGLGETSDCLWASVCSSQNGNNKAALLAL